MTSTSIRRQRSGTSVLAQTTSTAIAPQTYQSVNPSPSTDIPGTLTAPTFTANPVPTSISNLAVGDYIFLHSQANPITNGPWQVTNPATGELTRGHPNYGSGQTAHKGNRFVDQSSGITYELQADATIDTTAQDWQVVTEGLPVRVIPLNSTSPTYQILDGPGRNILMVDSSAGSPGNTNATSADGATVTVGAILPVNPSTILTSPTIIEVYDISNSFAGNQFTIQYGAHLRNGTAIADGLQELDGVNTAATLTYVDAATGFTTNEVWLREGGTPDVETIRNFRTVSLLATTAGQIPAGARSYSITNLGETAAGVNFHPFTVNGARYGTAERSVGDEVLESQDSFVAIPYNPNPDGNATPNTLRIIYQEVSP